MTSVTNPYNASVYSWNNSTSSTSFPSPQSTNPLHGLGGTNTTTTSRPSSTTETSGNTSTSSSATTNISSPFSSGSFPGTVPTTSNNPTTNTNNEGRSGSNSGTDQNNETIRNNAQNNVENNRSTVTATATDALQRCFPPTNSFEMMQRMNPMYSNDIATAAAVAAVSGNNPWQPYSYNTYGYNPLLSQQYPGYFSAQDLSVVGKFKLFIFYFKFIFNKRKKKPHFFYELDN